MFELIVHESVQGVNLAQPSSPTRVGAGLVSAFKVYPKNVTDASLCVGTIGIGIPLVRFFGSALTRRLCLSKSLATAIKTAQRGLTKLPFCAKMDTKSYIA